MDVTLTEFPDALHWYDKVEFPNPVKLPQSPSARNCWLEEGANGQLLNSKTGKPFDLSDPCLERGWQFGYNAVAYEATLASVKSFLRTTFNIN